MKRWKQKHWPRSLCRASDTSLSSHKCTLGDMEGNFFLIGVGVVAAFGVLLLERCCRAVKISKVFRANISRLDIHKLWDVELFRMRN